MFVSMLFVLMLFVSMLFVSMLFVSMMFVSMTFNEMYPRTFTSRAGIASLCRVHNADTAARTGMEVDGPSNGNGVCHLLFCSTAVAVDVSPPP